ALFRKTQMKFFQMN
ncbi:hypothetical protein HYALB_00003472, partial [Hymenoscyphus albidus]